MSYLDTGLKGVASCAPYYVGRLVSCGSADCCRALSAAACSAGLSVQNAAFCRSSQRLAYMSIVRMVSRFNRIENLPGRIHAPSRRNQQKRHCTRKLLQFRLRDISSLRNQRKLTSDATIADYRYIAVKLRLAYWRNTLRQGWRMMDFGRRWWLSHERLFTSGCAGA
jgi:hypothetical protein